mgnify:CR=1 FL=1
MCLGGGTPGAPTYQPPPPRIVEPGPESPQDSVNDQLVENANPRDQQQARRNANRGPTASGQKNSQSGSKSNKAY